MHGPGAYARLSLWMSLHPAPGHLLCSPPVVGSTPFFFLVYMLILVKHTIRSFLRKTTTRKIKIFWNHLCLKRAHLLSEFSWFCSTIFYLLIFFKKNQWHPNSWSFTISFSFLEAHGIFILPPEFWNSQWWALGWVNYHPLGWAFSGFILESNVYQSWANFLEYWIDNSSPFFILSFSISHFLLLNLLVWTPNFLISSLLLSHLLYFACFLQFYRSSIQCFFISAIMILLSCALFILWKFLSIAYCSYLMEAKYFFIPWRILIMSYFVF